MKVLELSAYFSPEQYASSYLWNHMSEAYAKAGVDRVVLCPIPCRGVSEDIRSEYKKKKDEYRFNGRLHIVRFPLYKEGKNPLFRAIRYSLMVIYMFFWAIWSKKAKDCDIVYVGSTPPIQGALAALVKKVKRIPFVYCLQDVFPDSLVFTGLAQKGGILWKIGRKIEDFTYKNADKIIVISQDCKRNIIEKGVPEDKIEVIYNWVDASAILPVSKENNPLYKEFDISPNDFNVVYAGNLGNAQNVMILIEAAKILERNKEIKFIIFGTGRQEQELKNAILKNNLENVKMHPLQSPDKVPFVYSLGDVCVVACKAGLGGSAMPSKTWSIMASGSAVIANFDEGELKNIIEDNDCGIFTKAGDILEFAKALKMMSDEPEKCKEMGRKGRKFVMDNLTKEVGTNKYLQVIMNVPL